jgi:hypothetical protein
MYFYLYFELFLFFGVSGICAKVHMVALDRAMALMGDASNSRENHV